MKKIRLAIIGLGVWGTNVPRPFSLTKPLRWLVLSSGHHFLGYEVELYLSLPHIQRAERVDAALICVPADAVMGVAKGLFKAVFPWWNRTFTWRLSQT